jgi:hypothetical protein
MDWRGRTPQERNAYHQRNAEIDIDAGNADAAATKHADADQGHAAERRFPVLRMFCSIEVSPSVGSEAREIARLQQKGPRQRPRPFESHRARSGRPRCPPTPSRSQSGCKILKSGRQIGDRAGGFVDGYSSVFARALRCRNSLARTSFVR